MEAQARRVLILGEASLLVRGVASLLEFDHNLDIVGITGDPEQALVLIKRLRPDVLLVDESRFPLRLGLRANPVELDCLPTLVTLHESDNQIRIFRIEERTLTYPAELIQALKA